MRLKNILLRVGVIFVLTAGLVLAGSPLRPKESGVKFENEKVKVIEATMAPGETWTWPQDSAAAVVYFDDGLLNWAYRDGMQRDFKAKRGTADAYPKGIIQLKNRGTTPLHLVAIEYQSEEGGRDYLGRTGHAPDYK